MSSDDQQAPHRPRRVDPTDVFSPWYTTVYPDQPKPQGAAEEPKADVAAPDSAPLLRGGFYACIAFAIALMITAIPLPHHSRVDTVLLHAINVLFTKLPFAELQYVVINVELVQLILATCVMLLWTARANRERSRDLALLAFSSGLVVYFASRVVQVLLHRPRPLFAETLHPLVQAGVEYGESAFKAWGSLPSDHAALYMIVIMFAFAVNRRAALVLSVICAWAVVYRIASGYHWPSDVCAGALVGTAAAVFALRFGHLLEPQLRYVQRLFGERPALMNAMGFAIIADFAQAFAVTKGLLRAILHVRMFH